MANEIYAVSLWGNPVEDGWGDIYYNLAFPSEVPSLLKSLESRSAYYENETCTTATLTDFEKIEL